MSEEPFMELIGIFDDDGNRYETDSIPTPPLCTLCRENDNSHPFEQILCTLARLEHMLEGGEGEFLCHAFAAAE
jgi:hypothetical protein